MRLGVTTDTLDAEGRVLETRAYAPPREKRFSTFSGGLSGRSCSSLLLISAIKVAGVPSYKLAREGKAEPLKPRQVNIYDIALNGVRRSLRELYRKMLERRIYTDALCGYRGNARAWVRTSPVS